VEKTFVGVDGNLWRICNNDDEADLAHYDGPNIVPGINLEAKDLYGARLSDVDLTRSKLSRASFKKAILSDASFQMAEARSVVFDDAHMNNVTAPLGDFRASSFLRIVMTKGNFFQCDLRRCFFVEADLTGCHFSGADFSGSTMRQVNFTNSNCFRTDFSRVSFYRVNFSSADLSAAYFIGSQFHESYYCEGFAPDAADEIIDLLTEVPMGFEWPSTDVQEESSAASELFDAQEWPQVGMLKHFGYTVGDHGLSANQRRGVLDEVFISSPLPQLNHGGYTEAWGDARSAVRLQKIADSIAAFARAQKRKSSPAWQAIEDWESDLSYLFETYYRGHFGFPWPMTDD